METLIHNQYRMGDLYTRAIAYAEPGAANTIMRGADFSATNHSCSSNGTAYMFKRKYRLAPADRKYSGREIYSPGGINTFSHI
jgi:hypothetical protein